MAGGGRGVDSKLLIKDSRLARAGGMGPLTRLSCHPNRIMVENHELVRAQGEGGVSASLVNELFNRRLSADWHPDKSSRPPEEPRTSRTGPRYACYQALARFFSPSR
jgi:hypothetical protein